MAEYDDHLIPKNLDKEFASINYETTTSLDHKGSGSLGDPVATGSIFKPFRTLWGSGKFH